MGKFIEHQNIPVANLLLDVDNYRYKKGGVKDQRGCIERIVKDPKANVIKLAEDIAIHGLYPEPIMAVKKSGKDWLVLEGNRRVTALKLLNNPASCPDEKKRQKLQAIKQSHTSNIPKAIAIHTNADVEEIHEYIYRRHTGENKGIGLINWGAAEVDNYMARRGGRGRYDLGSQALRALGDRVKISDRFPISTLDRIIRNKDARGYLDMTVEDGVIKAGKKTLGILKTVIEELETGKVNVSALKKTNQITEYLSTKQDITPFPINLKARGKNNESNSASILSVGVKPTKGVATKPASARINVIPAEYKNFVPKAYGKAYDIFIELQKLNLKGTKHACSLSLRTLIELSIRHYAKKKNIPLTFKKKGKDGAEKQVSKDLSKLIEDVCTHMQAQKFITGGDKTRTTGANSKSISVKDFNGYVHDIDTWPVGDHLMASWEAMKQVLELCWTKT